jgi:hypothetical protein
MCTGLFIRSLFNTRNGINQYRHSHNNCGSWGKPASVQFRTRVDGGAMLWIQSQALWAAAGPARGVIGFQQPHRPMATPIHRFIRRLWVHDRYLG